MKSIPVTKKGVYFAFRDQGACISLLAIKVYYITCPEVTINFAHFKATPTGKEITLIEQANGTCVANAEVVGGPPTYFCKGDGKWTLPTGGCQCKAGLQPDFEKQTCNGIVTFINIKFLCIHYQTVLKLANSSLCSVRHCCSFCLKTASKR